MESIHPNPSPTGTLRCIQCGAENLGDAPHCWNCGQHDWREEDEAFGPPYPIRFAPLRDALIVLGIVVVALFALARSPITTIILLFMLTPIFLISEIQALRCQRWGVSFSRRDRLLTVFKCLIVLVPLLLFVILAALLLYPLTPGDAYRFFWPLLPRNVTP